MDTTRFSNGTIARCNRRGEPSPLPKDVEAIKENDKAWRIQTFATLACGHMDTHWVYIRDLAPKTN